MPNASLDDLLTYLDGQYAQLNAALTGREGEPLANAVSALSHVSHKSLARRGLSDAVLFGHIAEALSNDTLSPLVSKHSALMAFFHHVCNAYFSTPYHTTKESDDQSWTVSDFIQICLCVRD